MTNHGSEMTEESKSFDDGGTFHLADYLAICLKRKWLIGGLVLTLSVGLGLWSSLQVPIYESSAGLVFEPPGPSIMLEANLGVPVADTRDILTQVALLKSYPVLAKTVRRLNIGQYPEYQYKQSFFQQMMKKVQPDWFISLKARIQEFLVGRPEDSFVPLEIQEAREFPDPVEQSLVYSFAAHIDTHHVIDTKWVDVTVQSENPAMAARAANTLSTVFIDHIQEVRARATETASQWFTNHLSQLREKVEESEKDLHAYRSKHRLVDVGEQQGMTGQTLSLVNSELVEAERQMTALESKIHLIENIRAKLKVQGNDPSKDQLNLYEIEDVLDSPEIQQIRKKEVELSIRMAELAERFGSLHPEITRLQIQRRALQSRLEAEVDRAHKLLKTDYELARQRTKAVGTRLAKQKSETLTDVGLSVKLSLLEREANSNRVLYDSFLKQMKETNLSKEINLNKVYLAEPAIPNRIPVKPIPIRYSLLGLLLGLGGGIGLAFFLEYWDRSLKGPQDLEQYLNGLLVLGWVPSIPRSRNKDLSRIIESEPLSVAADSYRHIRTSVRLLTSGKSSTELFITSPGEQEGKTTLAVNLAIAMTLLEGYQVVLIDGDLRRPRLHQIFGMQQNGNSNGLTEYLRKEVEITEIFHQTDIPNLKVIPAGKWTEDHTELLDSKRFTKLLAWCRGHNFHVIIDGSPVLTLSDSLVIAAQVSNTILVVSAGKTNREGAKLALQQLIGHSARVLGVVMQKVPPHSFEYYYRTYPPVSNGGPLKSLVNKTLSRLR